MGKKLWKSFLLLCLIGGLLLSVGCGKDKEDAVSETTVEQQAEEPITPAAAEETEEAALREEPSEKADAYRTDPVPADQPEPVEPQEAEISEETYHCTISISCETLLDQMDLLDAEKVELVPEDGVILQPVEVTFSEGENVFQVLQRVCKEQKIHLEFMDTPLYNSAYIEGIYNLYEFDAGDLSGWMYRVNGWFPNYGCSRYQLQDGDVIEWVYTCDLGDDVGGSNGAKE